MKKLMLVILAIWISGCSTGHPLQEMSKDGKSTAELMRQGVPESGGVHSSHAVQSDLSRYNYNPYTRNVLNETNMLFPMLPNPSLVMYIYPHISGSGVPVPGYATAFKIYETEQYALPGER
jgi:conjugative transfer region lipoprotein (TIGR03751 family)